MHKAYYASDSGRQIGNAQAPATQLAGAENAHRPINIGAILDEGPWARPQRLMILLTALVIVMDGFTGQLIGFATPLLIKEWGIDRSAFAPIIAAALVGMAVGATCAGYIGDRFGRKAATIASVLVFGLATMANGLAAGPMSLTFLRFLAGIGIGGALPSASILAAEYAPPRFRTFAVTATIICVPVGGTLAGLFSSAVLIPTGWRALFLIGGALPTILAVILAFSLAESPRWLAARPDRQASLYRLMARMGRPIPQDAMIEREGVGSAGEDSEGFAAIFRGGRLASTLCLWVAVFLTLLAVYTAFSWLPTMLTAEGLSPATAGAGLTAYNLGGVVGGMFCAWAVTCFGSRYPLLIFCAGGAASAFILKALDIRQGTTALIAGLRVHGLFVTSVQCLLFSLAAYVYPVSIRARGSATAMTVGRLGAILSAFLGAAVITRGGAASYFTTLGVAMLGAMTALAIQPRHIPPVRKGD
jgi:AAHS family 4-hydroxybenzoate transporter-like MFS transporter